MKWANPKMRALHFQTKQVGNYPWYAR